MSAHRCTLVAVAAATLLCAAAPAFAVDWPSGLFKCADEGGTCNN